MENTENSGEPIDFERLRDVSGDDEEMMEELLELYFSQTGEQLDELEKVVAAKDYEAIYRVAHKIAGGSLTCGMNEIVPPIRKLEQIGRNQTGENIEQLCAESRAAFAKMIEFLETSKEELAV